MRALPRPAPARSALRLLALVASVLAGEPAARGADLTKAWETGGFTRPESVVYDAVSDQLLVSNIPGAGPNAPGKGFVSRVGLDGTILQLKFADGLTGARGMAIAGRHLFVAEREELAGIDLSDGAILKRYPAPGSQFLNDVALGPDGRVFVSDTGNGAILVLDRGTLAAWVKDRRLIGANGIAVMGGHLLVGLTRGLVDAPAAPIETVDLATGQIGDLGGGLPIGAIDGLQPDGAGGLLATENQSGRVLRITSDGAATVAAVLQPGIAGLALIPDRRLAVIAEGRSGRLVALRLN